MKLYIDPTNGLTISVTDDGYGFPVNSALVALGMSVSPLIHKLTIEQSIRDFHEQGKVMHVLSNNAPLEDIENAAELHPYAGMTLDEVIAKFCPEEPMVI